MPAVRSFRLTHAAVVLGAVFAVACQPEDPVEPHYDEEIGMEAVPVEPGGHAGTFALKSVNTRIVHIPVLDDQIGGGVNYRLVVRTWDEASEAYEQRSLLCGGYNIEVAGVTTNVPESSYRRVPESVAELTEVTDDGQMTSTGHIQLWALRFEDGADPAETPLPATREEADTEPHASRIYDFEEDEKPGLTLFVSGAVEGEVYAIQRKFVDLEGISLGPDRLVGLADNRAEQLLLGNNNPLLDRSDEGSTEKHPDPKESWFEEVRIEDGSDCDRVMQAVDDEELSRARPF